MAERYVLLESHPNSPTHCWVGKIGTQQEVEDYIRERVERGEGDYLDSVIPLEEGAELEEIDGLVVLRWRIGRFIIPKSCPRCGKWFGD